MSGPALSPGVWLEDITDCPELKKFEDGLRDEDGKTAFKDGFVRFQPSGQVLPRCFADIEKEVTEFEVREDDVWVSSFPKCGTTWTQEMVWNIVHGVDLETARKINLEERVPFFELTGIIEKQHSEGMDEVAGTGAVNSMQQVTLLTSPRVIKTHLSIDMLPRQVLEKRVKLIYVTRNPRDTLVSYLNHWRIMAGYQGSFETLLSAFLANVCGFYSPFIQHVLGYWNAREQDQVLFLTYEEMKRDLPAVIRRVANFLQKDLSEEQVKLLASHLSFDNMKNNTAVNKDDVLETIRKKVKGIEKASFMRKGEVGDWENHLTKEQVERMQQWEERELSGSDFTFEYKI